MVVIRESICGVVLAAKLALQVRCAAVGGILAAITLLVTATHAVSQEKPMPPKQPAENAAPLIVAPASPAIPLASSPDKTGDKPAGKVGGGVNEKADEKTNEKAIDKAIDKAVNKTADKADEKAADKPVEPPKSIALILPLSSKALGRAAEAARAGFLVAAELSGKAQFEARVYLADDEAASLATLYRKAVADGAVAVVAGLTRDGATVVAREAGYLPTLALNTPSDLGKADANNFFHISLLLDWDARLAARAAADEGFRTVAIVYSNATLARRIQDAFEKEWLRLGGTVATRIAFSGDLNDGPKVKVAMEKPDAAKADVAFIAADMQVARFARPYLPQGLPVFATAHSFDPRAGAVENLDLDSVKYPEIPWFVERDHTAVMTYARPPEPLPAEYERLYALGIDAWRIMFALVTRAPQTGDAARSNAKQPFAPIDGVTGRISLDGNQFLRALPVVEMRDGKPQIAKSAD